MAWKKRRPQNDQRANLRGGGFVAIPHVVVDSPAWRGLSVRARAVLIELARKHNGYNNGKIGMSYRDVGAAIGTSSFRVIANAFAELIKSGFVAVEADALVWQRMAREYRITWLPTGEPPHQKPATEEYRRISGADAVSADQGKSADPVLAGKKSFDDAASARVAQKRQKSVDQPKVSADPVSSHILSHTQAPKRDVGDGYGSSPPTPTGWLNKGRRVRHAKFGLGNVVRLLATGAIEVQFDDEEAGSTRHVRSFCLAAA